MERGGWWGKVWAGEVSLGALQRPSGYNRQTGDGEETLQNPHTGVWGGGGGGGDYKHILFEKTLSGVTSLRLYQFDTDFSVLE